MKNENNEMENKKSQADTYVFLFCIILVIGFIFALPYLNDMVRESKEMKNKKEEEEKIPISYKCIRKEEEEDYMLAQEAVYTIEDEMVVKAHTERTYQFKNEEAYKTWVEEHPLQNFVGQTDVMKTDDIKLKVERTIDKDLKKMDLNNLEPTFPRTYDNLLIYTKEQDCISTY